jgi:hypothetical protein
MVEATKIHQDFHASAAVAAALTAGGRLIECSHTLTPETLSFAAKFNILGTEEEPT